MRRGLWLALAIIALPAYAEDDERWSKLGRVSVEEAGSPEIVVRLVGSRRPDFTTRTLHDPFRVVVEWSGSKLVGVPAERVVGAGLVRRIQTRQLTQESEQLSRVTIELARETRVRFEAEGTAVLVKLEKVEVLEPPVASAAPSPRASPAVAAAAESLPQGPLTEPAAPPVAPPPPPPAVARAAPSPAAVAPRAASPAATPAALGAAPRAAPPRSGASIAVTDTPRTPADRAVPIVDEGTGRTLVASDEAPPQRLAGWTPAAASAPPRAAPAPVAAAAPRAPDVSPTAPRALSALAPPRTTSGSHASSAAAIAPAAVSPPARAAAARGVSVAQLVPAKATSRADAPAETGDVDIDPGARLLTYVGFRQKAQSSEVFVRLDGRARYRVVSAGPERVVVEIYEARVNVKNNERPLDTSFFDSAVTRIQAVPSGSSIKVEIDLRETVPYEVKRIGSTISLDFKLPS